MSTIKPINFDPRKHLDSIEDDSQKRRKYMDEIRQRHINALPSVVPKVKGILDQALTEIVKKIRDPEFVEALEAANAQGGLVRGRFCDDFLAAIQRSVPREFPVVMEDDGQKVAVAQTYFGVVLYKYGLSKLRESILNLRDGPIQEKMSNFEHTARSDVEDIINSVAAMLGDIKPEAEVLHSSFLRLNKSFTRPSPQDEHDAIRRSFIRQMGLADGGNKILPHIEREDFEQAKRNINNKIKETVEMQKNHQRLNSLTPENAYIGVTGNIGDVNSAPPSKVSKISSKFKSLFGSPSGSGHDQTPSKPSGP